MVHSSSIMNDSAGHGEVQSMFKPLEGAGQFVVDKVCFHSDVEQ